jgi:hypothetical protein
MVALSHYVFDAEYLLKRVIVSKDDMAVKDI